MVVSCYEGDYILGEEVELETCDDANFCFVSRDIVNGTVYVGQGCWQSENQCYVKHPNGMYVAICCNEKDFCNDKELMDSIHSKFPWTTYSWSNTTASLNLSPQPDGLILIISVVFLLLSMIMFGILIFTIKRKTKLKSARQVFTLSFNRTSRQIGSQQGLWNRFEIVCRRCCFRKGTRSLQSEAEPIHVAYMHDGLMNYDEENSRLLRYNESSRVEGSNDASSTLAVPVTQQTTLNFTNIEEQTFSGSGGGRDQAKLVPKTVARSVQLIEIIGRGRFGEVWRGDYCGEQVAVKIFPSREEASWHREVYVFNHTRLRHENIVNFIAADVHGRGSITELWLVLSFHRNGSLFDYLMKNCIDLDTMLKFAASFFRGLHYLHSQIGSSKPAMAHCDLKSKNLLIKDDFSLCIADMGLVAVDGQLEAGSKTGTRRFMAPELLLCCQRPTLISSLIQADIYSSALVLWELLTRLVVAGEVVDINSYAPPFSDVLPLEPTAEEIYLLLIDQKYRPPIPKHLSVYFAREPSSNLCCAILQSYWNLIGESWSSEPSNRPPTLLLKKALNKFEKEWSNRA